MGLGRENAWMVMDGRMDGLDGWMDRRIYERNGRMDGGMNGWRD